MARVKYMSKANKIKTCALIISITAAIVEENKKSKRKMWTRQWLAKRNTLGCYENLMKELALEDAEGYRRYIRMDVASFEYLLEKVTPIIQKANTRMRKSIPPAERLAVTLRFLATGETQQSLHFQFRIAQNTISGILATVSRAIYQVLQEEYLSCPSTEAEWKSIASDFRYKWNFPMCIGAMDGKHVKISPPPGSGSTFYNYKGDFSIVLLAAVDANLKFIYVDVGTNGRISDGGVWAKSKLKQALDSESLNIPSPDFLPGTKVAVPYVLVADDAFGLNKNLMKPYPGTHLDNKRRVFNYRLSRARRVSENAFGILAARFRIYQRKICSTVSNAKLFVLATCALHNFLRDKVVTKYLPVGSIDIENVTNCTVTKGEWRNVENRFINLKKQPHRPSAVAKEVQSRFCEYFNSNGSVPWQADMCNLH